MSKDGYPGGAHWSTIVNDPQDQSTELYRPLSFADGVYSRYLQYGYIGMSMQPNSRAMYMGRHWSQGISTEN
jgi:hypothetical protein